MPVTGGRMDLKKALSGYQYAEVRIEHGADVLVKTMNKEVKVNGGSYEGVSARVLENGSWGFAAGNGKSEITSLLKQAHRLALLQKGGIKLKSVPGVRKKIKSGSRCSDAGSLAANIVDAGKLLEDRRIVSRSISCIDSFLHKEFYNSHGTEISQDMLYTYMTCSAMGRSDTGIQRASDTAASRNGFSEDKLFETAGNTCDKLMRLLGAKLPPKGKFDVVLDPEMTGVLCHEAVGHATEADSVIDRESLLRNKVGEPIGSSLVTIVDDPSADDFGQYAYDDEGVKAKKVTLVRNGVLQGFINSRETSMDLGIAPNGHARASGFNSVPIVRMSNTYLVPGKSSRDEVFDIRKGFYLKGMKGGSVDIFTGGFMFKADEAFEIRNGECMEVLRDILISGNILETLKSMVAVGKDFGTSPGMCGKLGQDVPVSDGGPHVRISGVRIG